MIYSILNFLLKNVSKYVGENLKRKNALDYAVCIKVIVFTVGLVW